MTVSEDLLQRVWEKGDAANFNPKIWRKDQCGAWISRIRHGDRNSDYEWEIDHINPNGGDDPSNLRPLQWKNSIDKGKAGRLTCPVTADGNRNVERQR
jgi:hypothetical protein